MKQKKINCCKKKRREEKTNWNYSSRTKEAPSAAAAAVAAEAETEAAVPEASIHGEAFHVGASGRRSRRGGGGARNGY